MVLPVVVASKLVARGGRNGRWKSSAELLLLLSRCCGVAGDGEEELGCWLTREKELLQLRGVRAAPSGRESCTVGERESCKRRERDVKPERERESRRAEEDEDDCVIFLLFLFAEISLNLSTSLVFYVSFSVTPLVPPSFFVFPSLCNVIFFSVRLPPHSSSSVLNL